MSSNLLLRARIVASFMCCALCAVLSASCRQSTRCVEDPTTPEECDGQAISTTTSGAPAAGSGGRAAGGEQAGAGGNASGAGGSNAGSGGEAEAGSGGAEPAAGSGAGSSGGGGADAAGAGGEAAAGGDGAAGMQPSAAGAGEGGEGGASGAGAGGAGAGGAGAGGAGMPATPQCTNVGALRCSPDDSNKRQRCSDGMWRDAEPCGEDEICAASSMSNPGSCVATAEVCRDRNGMSACDDAGVLYQCGDNGVVRGVMRCGSKELCMAGVMTGMCGRCVPGEFRCAGNVLQQCDRAGAGFSEMQRCESPELCRASEGRCADPVCNPGQKTCMGDELQDCRPDRTGFQRLRECGQGQCDATAGTCRTCMPGVSRCVGNMQMTCDAQGARETSENCLDRKSESGVPGRCDGNRCVECVGDAMASCGEFNQGECRIGAQMCRNGEWSECMGRKDPTPEVCNTKDDDCNGMVDDKVTDCPNNQACMNGKCGCSNASQCMQGELCADGSCVKPYAPCNNGSCPQSLTCDHGLCVPQCGNGCPGVQGVTVRCSRDVELDGDACLLVCREPPNPFEGSCPQNTVCRQVGEGVSICQAR
jgi:hypothetical protein